MEQNVILNLSVKDNNATKSVGTIRTQLREANEELVKAQEEFGQYSDEAVNAAKRVAELKDRVKDAAETAAAFDPGRRFAAFSSALQGVAGGFAAVQGALGLVGVESEDVQKQLLKVQSALALSQGLSQIGELGKSFKGVATVLSSFAPIQKANAAANTLAASTMRAFGVATTQTSVAFRVLRAAIIATGIGALVVAVGFLIEKIVSWTSSTEDAEKAQKSLNDEIDRQNKLLSQSLKEIDNATKLELARARAAGKSVDEIKKIKEKGYREELDALKNQQTELDRLADEADKNSQLKEEDRQKARQAANENFAKIQEKIFAKTLLDEEERATAAEAKRGKATKKTDDEIIKNTEEANAELKKLREDATLAAIKNETDRAIKAIDIQVENDKKRIEATKISDELKQQLLTEIEAKGIRDRQDLRDKAAADEAEKAKEAAEKKAKEDEERLEKENEAAQKRAEQILANQQLEFELRRAEVQTLDEERQLRIDEINAEFDLRVQRATETGESIINIEKLRGATINAINDEINAKEEFQKELRIKNAVQAADAISSTLGDVSKLVGEQTALGKTLAIAQAVIDTATSAIRAYQSTVGIPYVGPVLAPIAAATAVAFGVKNIRTIQQTKIPGAAGGGGGGSIPSLATAQAAPIPAQANPVVVGQELNRIAINQQGNAATRAYVVESDVTNSQERIKRLNRAARLG